MLNPRVVCAIVPLGRSGYGFPVKLLFAMLRERTGDAPAKFARTLAVDSREPARRALYSLWLWSIKVRDYHGVTQNMIEKTTQFPQTRELQGTAIVYNTPAIRYSCTVLGCTPVESMTMRVVNETKDLKGVITAYCLGVVVCPVWVRNAAA